MVKILHLIPTLEGGGAEGQLIKLANEQQYAGLDVHVALHKFGVNKQFANADVSFHKITSSCSMSIVTFISLLKIVRKVRPDVIQTWLPPMDIIGGFIASICFIPWVLTERSSCSPYPEYSIKSLLRKFVSLFSDVIVANSEKGKLYWSRLFFLRNKKIITIHNSVDFKKISEAEPFNFEYRDLYEYFLCVGRLDAGKSVETVIKSIAYSCKKKHLKLLIIGDGPLKSDLNNLIINLGLAENISIHPYNAEWWGMLKNATALISMSKVEGCPNILLESMAANCPLIVSDIMEHRSILSDLSASFIPLDEYKLLAIAIDDIILNKNQANERAKTAKMNMERYKINKVAESFSLTYEMILKK